MSFLATFSLEGQTFNVLHFQQGVRQEADYNGKPKSSPSNGIFTLTFESTSDSNITEWMISETMMKQGKITFNKRQDPGKLYEFEFADAFCIGYEEKYNHKGSWPLTTTIVISAGVVRTRGTTYERPWKLSSLGGAAAGITASPNQTQSSAEEEKEEKEPTIQETYFQDSSGNKIQEVVVGSKVTLIVKTKDMVGETLDIDLSDNSKDFKYNGQAIENDMIKGIPVKGDTVKIDLEVQPQTK